MARAGNGADKELTKHTPYLALTGELWSVLCEHLGEKGSFYKEV